MGIQCIRITADDTTGMVNRITEVISRDLKLSIRSMNLTSAGGLSLIHI